MHFFGENLSEKKQDMCQALFRQHVMQILLYITFTLILLYITWLLSEGNWVGKGRGDVTSTEDGWRLVLVERGEHHITAGQVPRELNWLHREQEMGGKRKGRCYFHRRLLETGAGGG